MLIRKAISVSERHQEMLDELMAQTGSTTETEIFRAALVAYYKANVQNYIVMQSKRSQKMQEYRGGDSGTLRRMSAEERKRDTEQYGKEICDKLEGKAFKEGANMICRWTTYDMVNPKHVIMGELEVPFEQLNESHVQDQYQNGTKAEIKKAIEDGASVE